MIFPDGSGSPLDMAELARLANQFFSALPNTPAPCRPGQSPLPPAAPPHTPAPEYPRASH